MFSLKGTSSHKYYLAAAAAVVILGIVGNRAVMRSVPGVHLVSNVFRWAGPTTSSHHSQRHHQYEAQIFSRDPLILYIDSFLSSDEIAHVLNASVGKYHTSEVFGGTDSHVDLNARVSESAIVPRDEVVRRIEKRAMKFMGWRGSNTYLQRMKAQRYEVNGFYTFHYDFDPLFKDGNRPSTFMIYLVADCTGGGTNFPRLQQPNDNRWCDVIECSEEGRDGYEGVTFKPIAGNAIFWENMHPNGSFHVGVRHASLPVKSGEKVGLNIWAWDDAWKNPDQPEEVYGRDY